MAEAAEVADSMAEVAAVVVAAAMVATGVFILLLLLAMYSIIKQTLA